MSDLVNRLRDEYDRIVSPRDSWMVLLEAADYIEELEAEAIKLRASNEQFELQQIELDWNGPSIAHLRDIVLMAKPVAATARNTNSVRTGHELSGYTKHYIVPTYLITAAKAALEGGE